ncbi:MAG: pyruvate kinase [bacterium]
MRTPTRTKIVATIGPATRDLEAIRELREAGMGVARLNLSHAELEWHAETIRRIREAAPDVPVLLDLPGRKIRTAQLAHEPTFRRGDTLVLTTDPTHDGTAKVPVSYDHLHEDLTAGDVILADDGTLRFTVVEIAGLDIRCRAEMDGQLKSRKGINVPHVRLRTRLLGERELRMIRFAEENGADYVGVSFVESAAHVEAVRSVIRDEWPRIVAKVENQRGLDRVEEVAKAADAIMIDRGDLSVETSLENLAVLQKRIVEVARRFGKPVIVATEMLHSMIKSPFPTKAEVTDIANAVFDGASATMLSGETASGENAHEAVEVMRRVIESSETHLHGAKPAWAQTAARAATSIPEAMGEAIGLLCRSLPLTKIVAVTLGGFSARMVSAQHPSQPILAVTNDARAARAFHLMPGVRGIAVDVPFSRDSTDHIARCLEELWRRGEILDHDLILVTSVSYPSPGNRMNLIETHRVADLVRALGWKPAATTRASSSTALKVIEAATSNTARP